MLSTVLQGLYRAGVVLASDDPLGVIVDHLNGHVNIDDVGINIGASGGDDDDSDESNATDQHLQEFLTIQPFLKMARAAYKDTSMAAKFSFVRRSQLIRNVRQPSVLYGSVTTDTKVHVCVLEDGSLLFAFRGTELNILEDPESALSDLMTDLMIEQTPVKLYDACDHVAYQAHPDIKAHKGFQLSLRDVTKTSRPNENLRLVAEGLGAPRRNWVRRVICVGHSLGGALATLAAHWCRYVGYPRAQIWCVTIGSPRVGNRMFARDFNENVVTKGRSYRVVNRGDFVPNLPIFDREVSIWTMYKHVDGMMCLSDGRMYLSDEQAANTSEGATEIVLQRGNRRAFLHRRSLEHHGCISYKESARRVLAALAHLGPAHRLLHNRLPPLDRV